MKNVAMVQFQPPTVVSRATRWDLPSVVPSEIEREREKERAERERKRERQRLHFETVSITA